MIRKMNGFLAHRFGAKLLLLLLLLHFFFSQQLLHGERDAVGTKCPGVLGLRGRRSLGVHRIEGEKERTPPVTSHSGDQLTLRIFAYRKSAETDKLRWGNPGWFCGRTSGTNFVRTNFLEGVKESVSLIDIIFFLQCEKKIEAHFYDFGRSLDSLLLRKMWRVFGGRDKKNLENDRFFFFSLLSIWPSPKRTTKKKRVVLIFGKEER